MNLKLNFTTPLPNNQQQKYLHALKELGFHAERVFQDGQYILFKYYGRLPSSGSGNNIDFKFSEDVKDYFQSVRIDNIEFYLMFERKVKE